MFGFAQSFKNSKFYFINTIIQSTDSVNYMEVKINTKLDIHSTKANRSRRRYLKHHQKEKTSMVSSFQNNYLKQGQKSGLKDLEISHKNYYMITLARHYQAFYHGQRKCRSKMPRSGQDRKRCRKLYHTVFLLQRTETNTIQ